jgi:hypothetical protein
MITYITADKAIAMIQAGGDDMPHRILNSAGQAALVAFVAEHSKNPNAQNMGAWFAEAEFCANGTPLEHAVTLEIGRHATRAGNPAVLVFESAHFDWAISDAV